MDITNVQNEILVVGALFKNPDLYIEYGIFIKSRYDFSDDVTRFLYDNFEIMYKTFSQSFDAHNVNTFMSQDKVRLATYNKIGKWKTIQTWMDMSNADDFKAYLENIKKYSLLREYARKGYDVKKIMEHKRFHTFTAEDIYKIIRSGVDKISTVILTHDESLMVNKNLSSSPKKWLLKPQMGMEIPFSVLNDMFRGFRLTKMFAFGLLSNEGKSRLAILMACYIAFVKQEKVLFLGNEMGEEDFLACAIITVINNSWFKELHGIELDFTEKELVLGLYKDGNGKLVERNTNKDGEFTESEDEYVNRVYGNSETFRKVIAITEWVESQIDSKLFFKPVIKDYSDNALEFEIRKHKLIHGCSYIFYDTMKCYKEENWAMLKQTTTMLNSLMIELNCFCWGSIQLTDDSVFTDVFSFSSNNISSAKQIKHILDHLALGKRIDKEDYHKYKYIPNNFWGENPPVKDLDKTKTLYALKIDKNRAGGKDKIPLLEVDLDRNIWREIGVLIKNKR